MFRLAQPDDLGSILRGAGFRDVSVESRELTWEWASAEAYWEMQSELVAPLRAAIRTLPATALAELRAAVVDGLIREQGNGVIRLKAVPLCATATR